METHIPRIHHAYMPHIAHRVYALCIHCAYTTHIQRIQRTQRIHTICTTHVQPYSAHRMGKMYTQHRRCSVIMERHTVLKLDRDRFICQFHKKPATISGVFERIQHTLRASFLSALNRSASGRCHGADTAFLGNVAMAYLRTTEAQQAEDGQRQQ